MEGTEAVCCEAGNRFSKMLLVPEIAVKVEFGNGSCVVDFYDIVHGRHISCVLRGGK